MEHLMPGVRVLGVGLSQLGDCGTGRSNCRCCCKDNINMDNQWTLVDTKTKSLFGPTFKIKSKCTCLKDENNPKETSSKSAESKDESEEEGNLASLTSAFAVTASEKTSCSVNSCLNGGKCVPGYNRKKK